MLFRKFEVLEQARSIWRALGGIKYCKDVRNQNVMHALHFPASR
jgi:hypothetical protein